jgi:hypothetical protein
MDSSCKFPSIRIFSFTINIYLIILITVGKSQKLFTQIFLPAKTRPKHEYG